MIYFFHHYELPVIIQQAQLQQILLQTRDGQVPPQNQPQQPRQQQQQQQQPQPQQQQQQQDQQQQNGPQQQHHRAANIFDGLINAMRFQRRNNDNNNNNRNILISLPRYYGLLAMNLNNNNNNNIRVGLSNRSETIRNIAHSLVQSLRANVAAGMELLGNMNLYNNNNNNNTFVQRFWFGFGGIQNRDPRIGIRIINRVVSRGPTQNSGTGNAETNTDGANEPVLAPRTPGGDNIATDSAVDPRTNYQRNYEANNFIFPEAVLTQRQQQRHQLDQHQSTGISSEDGNSVKAFNFESVADNSSASGSHSSGRLEKFPTDNEGSLEPSLCSLDSQNADERSSLDSIVEESATADGATSDRKGLGKTLPDTTLNSNSE